MPSFANVIAPLGPFAGIAGGVHLLITQNVQVSGWTDQMTEYVSILGMVQLLNLEPWITGDDYFKFEVFLNMAFNAAELGMVWYNQAFLPFSTQWAYWLYPSAACFFDLVALVASWFADDASDCEHDSHQQFSDEDYDRNGERPPRRDGYQYYFDYYY